jgi:SOS response regulatory protein OraA/RecX
VGADRYERSDARKDYRSGHYKRKLRSRGLDTAIIERYWRR